MKKIKWIIDAIALIALLLVFMPGLTGFLLHEWIGLAIAGVLLVHFLQHWNWVISTSQRLKKIKGKVLSRYLIDGGLALGFSTITVTGLVISSLLMLPLGNYEVWRYVHVLSSYLTAFLLVVKLIMHWDMVAKILRKTLGFNKQPVTELSVTLDQKKRREFLRGAGITAIAGVVAITEFADWQKSITSQTEPDTSSIEPDEVELLVEAVPTLVPTEPQELVSVVEEEPEITPQPTAAPTIVPTAIEEIKNTGVVKCRKGCSYPGKCGRYTDSANNNNLCDLGEPIW